MNSDSHVSPLDLRRKNLLFAVLRIEVSVIIMAQSAHRLLPHGRHADLGTEFDGALSLAVTKRSLRSGGWRRLMIGVLGTALRIESGLVFFKDACDVA